MKIPLLLLFFSASPLLAQDADTVNARIELARVLTYDKKFDEAAKTFREVLAQDPQNVAALKGLGQALFWGGKPKESLEVAEKISAAQRDAETNVLLGDLFVIAKNLPDAETAFTAYLAEKPDDAAVRVRLADVQSWRKEYPKALENFEIVLKQLPEDKQVRRKYGTVLSWAGRYEDAARELKAGLDQ
jgi:predicted Zn-dependent protease